tara:strand:+ start:192 stop:1064 length:873 start_codon:yes stop_codon:yes gene_type:complete
MYDLIPFDKEFSINGTEFNNKEDKNVDRIGIYQISTTSNQTNAHNMFNNNTSYWSSFNTFEINMYDPVKAANANYSNSICTDSSVDCLNVFGVKGDTNSLDIGVPVINYYEHTSKNTLIKKETSIYGEKIEITFPRSFYIFEMEIYFNSIKPKRYYLFGKTDETSSNNPNNNIYDLLHSSLNFNTNKDEHIVKINKPTKYKTVCILFNAVSGSSNIEIQKLQFKGSTTLEDATGSEYKKFKEYFTNKKKVTFSDTKYVYEYSNNNNINLYQYFPPITISLLLLLTIIKRK